MGCRLFNSFYGDFLLYLVVYFGVYLLYPIYMGNFFEITNSEYEITERGYCVECQKNLPPRKTKYCSKECCDTAIKKSQDHYLNEQKTFRCVRCRKEFKYEKHKSAVYCSTECQKQTQYDNNRSDFSKTDVTQDLRTDGKLGRDWLPACALPLKVMRVVEAEADNNFVWEDMAEINKILEEELPVARYANGKVYQPDVSQAELRKQKAHEWVMINRGLSRKEIHKYGKRKEFMALVKNKSDTDTSTED